jgi:predicted phage terminase large subunit-like protein
MSQSMSSPELTSSKSSSANATNQAELDRERQALYLATVGQNSWLRHKPTGKQAQFLHLDCREAFYGGAAGGGKSSALLMGALQFVDVPGYSALVLRKTYTDLSLPGALMDRAREWLTGTAATWHAQEHTWRFPAGSSLTFGYLDNATDHFRYQSSEFQYIAFDELTQFDEAQYQYLFSRLRRLADSRVPLRMRSASNPGGVGHTWVKKRFVSPEGQAAGRVYVPALLTDNPHLDQAAYTASLQNLDPFTRLQLLEGNWTEFSGNHFHPHEWPKYSFTGDAYVLPGHKIVHLRDTWRFAILDPATTAGKGDYTVILVMGVAPLGEILVLDVFRRQIDVGDVVGTLASVCRTWKPLTFVGLENVGFQVLLVREAARHREIPTPVPVHPRGKGKIERAVTAIQMGNAKKIVLPEEAPWLDAFVVELAAFVGKGDQHDDQVDCLSYAAIAAERFRSAATEADRQAGVLSAGYSPTLPLPERPLTGALGFGAENPDYRPLGSYGGLRIFDR